MSLNHGIGECLNGFMNEKAEVVMVKKGLMVM